MDLEPPPVEGSREYATALDRLTRLDRQLGSDPESLDRPAVVQAVDRFLRVDYRGGGYASGLVEAARLIVEFRLGAEDLPDVDVPRSPHDDLLDWCLTAGRGDASGGLDADRFEFCMARSEWRRLLLRTVAIHGASVPLTDDQIARLSTLDVGSVPVVPVARALRERGRPDAAADLVAEALDARTSLRTPVPLLAVADDLGLEERFRRHLRGSLNRWEPEQGVDRLESLVEFGRRAECYPEIVLAVERWLRECEPDPADIDGRLIAASIEALLCGTDTGREDALELYRTYLFPAAELFDVGPELFEAADAAGRREIATDVLTAYDADTYVSGESDRETGMMAARAAETDERWHDAFDVWAALLEDHPDPAVCRNAVENRLRVGDLETAEEYVERLEEEFGQEVRAARFLMRIGSRRNNARRVVEVAESTDGVFPDASEDDAEAVATAYVESLAGLGRWERLESFLEDDAALSNRDRRFYDRLSRLMQYVQEDGAAVDGQTAVDVTERLLAAPIDTSELQLLLNLGVVRKVADRVRTEHPDLEERLDVVEGLVDILVSLHAERFIDELSEAGVDTDGFERNLAESDLRRGGRQLLTELEREARRAGITEAH
ncbi:hypothetical protein GCM10027435_08540 [Haloparvum alkalitolerans]|uniref:hypothetical protein n=1 Tax=Haloparvum alkalitolerans TaxID=1042953 RepID=UPI003CEEF898